MRALVLATRTNEWWEYKLAPVLATAYASAYLLGIPLYELAGVLAVLLLALVPGAVYVSLLNDVTDREDDRRSGKPIRFAGRFPSAAWAAVAISLLAGAAIAALAWRAERLTIGLYAGAWIAFGAYSVRPLRLKERGAAGVLADAAGAHLFPHLLAVSVVFAQADEPFAGVWPAAVGVWALAHGVRGILWHQLDDLNPDAHGAVRTFARRNSRRARWIGTWVVFPLELAAFGTMLVAAGSAVAIALVPAYALLEVRRVRRWGGRIVVLAGRGVHRIAMQEYYIAFYPLAFLVASSLRDPRDLLVLAVHLMLFPQTVTRTLREARLEIRDPRRLTGLQRTAPSSAPRTPSVG
jgi:4-hydroxybenzoate polyprenyltransferase